MHLWIESIPTKQFISNADFLFNIRIVHTDITLPDAVGRGRPLLRSSNSRSGFAARSPRERPRHEFIIPRFGSGWDGGRDCPGLGAGGFSARHKHSSNADGLTFFGRALKFWIVTCLSRFDRLWKPRSKLQARGLGNAACPHDLVAEREPVLVLDGADRNSKL